VPLRLVGSEMCIRDSASITCGKIVLTMVPSMITSEMAIEMKTRPIQRLRVFVIPLGYGKQRRRTESQQDSEQLSFGNFFFQENASQDDGAEWVKGGQDCDHRE
jgi:hypothetical protein